MRKRAVSLIMAFALVAIINVAPVAKAQQGSEVKTVEITPATIEAEVGQQLKFAAVARDASGKPLNLIPGVWIAVPNDVAVADVEGVVTFYQPGTARVGAIVGNKVGYATVVIKPARVARIDIEPLKSPLVVKGGIRLLATPRISNGNPRTDVTIKWTSENPDIATVDAAGFVVGIKPGNAVIKAEAEGGSGTLTVNVIANPVSTLAIEPRSITARTGDVVGFEARARDAGGNAVTSPSVRWSISGEGAMIEPDGEFVAERPGTYIVTATSGEHNAVASVVVTPRNIEREIEIVGRAPFSEFQAAEQWIRGKYAYVSTISDRLLTYDISDPSKPRLTHTLKFDARILNDFSTTADGRIGVLSREGASSRRNGIVFLDMSDPAKPEILSEYTQTVTGGVHSAFVDGHYVYLTDDATGSMRVIDFKDVKNPKEVARWEVPNPLAKPVRTIDGDTVGGRYLHDVQVVDGLAYLAYWRDGLVILDVGKGIKGGSPERPKLVSQFRFNHNELYGSGWIAGTHAVFRYKDYVFVGDEVFPDIFNIQSKERFPVRGIVHVIDVKDLLSPRKVAEYIVPESGSHNIWVKDDVLYMGYYNGGGRIVDVSGELRGDLYRQGREIARVWTGDPGGFRTNQPLTWGAQPVGDLIYFNDINTGLWIVKLGKPKDKGSTTAPGY
jgi:hypothetical protein